MGGRRQWRRRMSRAEAAAAGRRALRTNRRGGLRGTTHMVSDDKANTTIGMGGGASICLCRSLIDGMRGGCSVIDAPIGPLVGAQRSATSPATATQRSRQLHCRNRRHSASNTVHTHTSLTRWTVHECELANRSTTADSTRPAPLCLPHPLPRPSRAATAAATATVTIHPIHCDSFCDNGEGVHAWI